MYVHVHTYLHTYIRRDIYVLHSVGVWCRKMFLIKVHVSLLFFCFTLIRGSILSYAPVSTAVVPPNFQRFTTTIECIHFTHMCRVSGPKKGAANKAVGSKASTRACTYSHFLPVLDTSAVSPPPRPHKRENDGKINMLAYACLIDLFEDLPTTSLLLSTWNIEKTT